MDKKENRFYREAGTLAGPALTIKYREPGAQGKCLVVYGATEADFQRVCDAVSRTALAQQPAAQAAGLTDSERMRIADEIFPVKGSPAWPAVIAYAIAIERALLSRAAPSGEVAKLRGTLYAIAKTYDDHELRQKALEAYEESSPQPSAQQADTMVYYGGGLAGNVSFEQPAEEAQDAGVHCTAHVDYRPASRVSNVAEEARGVGFNESRERESFEAKFAGFQLDAATNGEYMNPYVEHLWEGWRQHALLAPPAAATAQEPVADTGSAEADRIIGRLMSADPDFDDCTAAAAFIRRIVAEHKGPEGFATWREAAIAERVRRVKAEQAATGAQPVDADQRAAVEYFHKNPSMAVLAFDRRRLWTQAAATGAQGLTDELLTLLRNEGTITGGRIYYPERKLRAMLAQAAPSAGATGSGQDELRAAASAALTELEWLVSRFTDWDFHAFAQASRAAKRLRGAITATATPPRQHTQD